jgi:transcriptional regulator with XRE-family HTH domain
MARGTLDHLRRQILRRLKQSGATQGELAKAVGHSGGWLSMILRGQREIKFAEIDRIAAFLEVSPSALFEDPDLDSSVLQEGTQHAAAPSDPRSALVADARLREQRAIIARQAQALDRHQRTIDDVLSFLQPAVRALAQLAPLESARPQDRRVAAGRRADQSKRTRSAGGGRR